MTLDQSDFHYAIINHYHHQIDKYEYNMYKYNNGDMSCMLTDKKQTINFIEI